MSPPPWPSAWRLTCAPGAAEEDAKWLALMMDLEELDDVELGDDVAGLIIPAPKLLVWPSEDNWSLEIENTFAEEQPASLEQVLLPSSIAAEDTLWTVSCEGSAASATEDAQASPSVEPMTGEHEPFVDHEPIKENSCNEVIEIDSSSDSDEDMPSRPRRRLRPHRYNVYSDSDVEMEEADEIEEPENKPKLPLPTPPPFHPITKAPNIAMPGEGYDPTFVWEVWAILDRANYKKRNETCLVQWCDKEHRFCATWVWATILFEDGFAKEMLRIDKRKDQYGHLTYAQFDKRFPSTYKASADGKCFFKALRIACHVVGGTDIVPLPLIEAFEDMLKKDAAKKGEELEEGVTLGVIKKFLAFLRSRRAPLACNGFSKNQLNRSITSFEGLCESKLNPGVCVVGAACARQIKHCFVLRVYGDKRPRRVFNRWYEGGEDDDYYDEPLENLLWIRRCHFFFCFERVGEVVRKRTTIKKKKLAKE